MRKLQPCGTHAAYARHLRNNEEPCAACKAANSARAQNAPSGGNKEVQKYDAIVAAEPPVITWRKTRRGIWVATSVYDPHAETTIQAQADRLRASAMRAEQLMAIEAYEVAERFRKHRADNTPLMVAARTEI